MNASYYKYRAHAGNVSGGRLVSPLPVLVVVNIKENKRMKGKLAALIYTSFSLSPSLFSPCQMETNGRSRRVTIIAAAAA